MVSLYVVGLRELRTFKPNAILGWFLEILLISIFESLKPSLLLGCDPFIFLPLQPSVVFLLGFLALPCTRIDASIILTAHRSPRARGRPRRVGVTMIVFTGGGFSVCFVALAVAASATVVFVAFRI